MNQTTLLTGLGASITNEPTLGGINSAGEATPGSGDLFMAMFAAMLEADDPTKGATGELTGALDGQTGLPVAEGENPATVGVPANGDAAAELPAEVPTEPTADVLAMLGYAVSPLLAQAITPQPDGTAPASTGPAPVTTEAAATAPATPVDTTAAPAPTTEAPTAEAATSASDAQNAQTAQDASSADNAASTGAPSAAPARVESAPQQTQAPITVAGATSVTAPAAPASVSDAAAAQPAPRVTEQVFPEVVRVAGAEGGPQRVTVKLNPEALGEVRVVLTHRRGELEVSLAGGKEAQRALTEGAPELRRLLEAVGRGESRIVIRDLPTGTTTAPTPVPAGSSARTDVSADLAGGAWSGADRPGSEATADHGSRQQHPGSTNATDGTPSATPASRPITPAGRSHSGLDLSM